MVINLKVNTNRRITVPRRIAGTIGEHNTTILNFSIPVVIPILDVNSNIIQEPTSNLIKFIYVKVGKEEPLGFPIINNRVDLPNLILKDTTISFIFVMKKIDTILNESTNIFKSEIFKLPFYNSFDAAVEGDETLNPTTYEYLLQLINNLDFSYDISDLNDKISNLNDSKLDKDISQGNGTKIYAKDNLGSQIMIPAIANSINENSIPLRNSNGTFSIGDAVTSDEPITKRQFDDIISNALFDVESMIENAIIGFLEGGEI